MGLFGGFHPPHLHDRQLGHLHPAGSFSYFGIKTKWSSPATEGKYTITVQIDSWSGNENRIDNNADAEKIDFFDN